jgi:hypothetical protein
MKISSMRWLRPCAEFEADDACADATFVLYFGPNDVIADQRFQQELRTRCPQAQILGCTTGTYIERDHLHDEQAIAIAVTLENSTARMASAPVSRETSRAAGAQIAAALAAPDLAGVLVLCDSLNVDGAELLNGMRGVLGLETPISGGLASDGSDFVRTMVGANCAPQEGMVAALGFYGSSVLMAQGCAHGWDNFGPPRRITKAIGPVLYELDGKPALDLYEHYLGDYAQELPGSALRFPLLVCDPRDPNSEVIRTVLNVDREARSLTFAASIEEGWSARLMRGAFDHLAAGAGNAARQVTAAAHEDLTGLALLVSCVGRRIVLGDNTADEVEAVAAHLPAGISQFGFYSHGEISAAPNEGFCGLHNQTMTIFTLQEAA